MTTALAYLSGRSPKGIVMSGWRPFGNVVGDDIWAWTVRSQLN
jgi:hypothetical protein